MHHFIGDAFIVAVCVLDAPILGGLDSGCESRYPAGMVLLHVVRKIWQIFLFSKEISLCCCLSWEDRKSVV